MAVITVNAAQLSIVRPEVAEVVPVIPSVAVTPGQAAYLIGASGLFDLAEADAAGKQQFRGIFLKSVAAKQTVPLLKRGYVYGYDLSSLNFDAPLFLSNTTGALDTAAGTLTVQVGRVVPIAEAGRILKVAYIEADWLRTWS